VTVSNGSVEIRGCNTSRNIEVFSGEAEHVRIENSSAADLKLSGLSGASIQRVRVKGLEILRSSNVHVLASELDHVLLDDTSDTRWIGNMIRRTGSVADRSKPVVYLMAATQCDSDTGFSGRNYFAWNVIVSDLEQEFDRCSAVRIMCSSDNVFENNVIYSVDCMGAYLRDNPDRNVFRGNFLWKRTRNTGFGAPLEYADGNDDKHEASYNLFTGNVIRSDQGPAIVEALHSGGNEYSYNEFISHGPEGAVLRVDPSQINPNRTPAVYGSANRFHHNTFYNPEGTAVSVGTTRRWCWRNVTNFEFMHNIVASTGARIFSYMDGVPIAWPASSDWSNFRSDYNIFFQGASPPSFGSVNYPIESESGYPDSQCGGFYSFLPESITYGSLSGWRSVTGSDRNSNLRREGTEIVNPEFLDISRGNFQIGSDSDAIYPGSEGTAGAYLFQNPSCAAENWECSPWSPYVTTDGFRMRSCRDLNECHTRYNRPDFTCCDNDALCGESYSGPMPNRPCAEFGAGPVQPVFSTDRSYNPNTVVLGTAALPGDWPSSWFPFVVTLRDEEGVPIVGKNVVLDFAQAEGVRLARAQEAGTLLQCAMRTLTRPTNEEGQAIFHPYFGGYQADAAVRVWVDGTIVGQAEARSADIDASRGVGASDLSLWMDLSGRSSPEADFDLSGMPGGNDLALLSEAFGSTFGIDVEDPWVNYCP
jgi:hypothetical protein